MSNVFEEQFANDTVDIHKVDGSQIRNRKASFDGATITFYSTEIPIDRNDHIMRRLPHGRTENYRVIDPGYDAGAEPDIPACYEAKVVRI